MIEFLIAVCFALAGLAGAALFAWRRAAGDLRRERAEDEAGPRFDDAGPVALSLPAPELIEPAIEELTRAIETGAIEPFFQPFVELGTGRVLGFEVLARWREASGRVRAPAEFLPLAEDSGLVDRMYYSLLAAAVEEVRDWPAEWSFAVNLSPRQIGSPDLAERTLRALHGAGLEPERLEIEISEKALEGDLAGARILVGELRENGLRVTLDNFGTGALPLTELARFRFDRIKVDAAAVRGEDGDASPALGLIAAAARHLGVPVLVQGIETWESAATARVQGCAVGQGFLFGRPDPQTECFRLDGVLAGGRYRTA